jgi:hypothetical protein
MRVDLDIERIVRGNAVDTFGFSYLGDTGA